MFETDGARNHAKRLADWIIEKMGGEGRPYTESGRKGQRTPTHTKAENDLKRDINLRGDPFVLSDVLRWMSLFFRSCRECGLD